MESTFTNTEAKLDEVTEKVDKIIIAADSKAIAGKNLFYPLFLVFDAGTTYLELKYTTLNVFPQQMHLPIYLKLWVA